MRPKYTRVRARSANDGSGTGGWSLVGPGPACFLMDKEVMTAHSGCYLVSQLLVAQDIVAPWLDRGRPTFTFFVKMGTARSYHSAGLRARVSWLGTGAVAVQRLSELRLRRRGCSVNQLVGQGEEEKADADYMSPHLYKKRKGGPATRPGKGATGARRCFTSSRTTRTAPSRLGA